MDEDKEFNSEKPRIWINLKPLGLPGRIIGVIICTIAGAMGGFIGSTLAVIVGAYIQAGFFGQSEPGIIGQVIAGAWIFGIFGIIPGIIIGITYGSTNNSTFWLIFVLLAAGLACVLPLAYGYPTSIQAACFYIFTPILTILSASLFASRVKIHLGLMPSEQAMELIDAQDEFFDDE